MLGSAAVGEMVLVMMAVVMVVPAFLVVRLDSEGLELKANEAGTIAAWGGGGKKPRPLRNRVGS